MSEEIIFYGSAASSTKDLLNLKSDKLGEFGINLPVASRFTLAELQTLEKDNIPWPVVTKIKNPEQIFCNQKIVYNAEEFNKFVSQASQDSHILINLPPQADVCSQYVNIFCYLAVDYICIYSANNNRCFLINRDNSGIFQGINLDTDYVLRLVRGKYGWFVDNMLPYACEALNLLRSYTLNSLNNPKYFQEFKAGYKLGFQNTPGSNGIFCFNNLANSQYIGEPILFGFQIGAIIKEVGKFSDLDNQNIKSGLIKSYLTYGKDAFDNVIKIVNLHNAIINEDADYVIKNIKDYIPDIMYTGYSGDGPIGNLLANTSDTLLSFDKAIDKGVLQACQIPADIDNIKVQHTWKDETSQFRILSEDYNNISIRFQSKKGDYAVNATLNGEIIPVVNWSSKSNLEWDLNIPKNNDTDKIKALNFNLTSNYHSSSATYASIFYVEGSGFHSTENNVLVIPEQKFLKQLHSSINLNINLPNLE
jgi:hypothetical protein